ncbi:guanine nucleotide-binding protein-like 1 [Ischnura elegans]|uniref:guanine nucleotide-binding protein-like 1 n=1 Tax=Ischnura elegans TaxID=197161 RepID=UPI001ED8AE54|nr:guanine nucleotide-binding protein-like 1 [Ischnura elegans]
MPQGRRKTPFSGKAKKQQLQAKKHKQMAPKTSHKLLPVSTASSSEESFSSEFEVRKLNQQPVRQVGKANPNRYVLQFHRDSPDEVRRRKEEALMGLEPRSEVDLEIDADSYFPPGLDFPVRPPWNFSMSKNELEGKEQRYFMEYVSNIRSTFEQKDLSYFELNLETWRQLWRVLEMSEIILVIVDIRFAPLMFPPSLYKYVNEVLKKEMILVLNKIDLAPAPLVVAWKHYFKQKYPDLRVLTFTSFPSYNLHGNQSKTGLKSQRRRGKLRMSAEGAMKLLECCEELVKGEVDLSSWHKKISEEMKTEYEDDELEVEESTEFQKVDTSFIEAEKYKDGTLTIGCIGQPNVGKSSLMNALMGKKVVSVSKTPGHTKHFQTIFLTRNVRLCDCPGLVFPSKVPKHLQVLMGSYPIAQLQEPYSSIRFLAERLDLIKQLKLQHADGNDEWSPMDVCEAWAKKRGYLTAKAARLDTYRAANHLLRMATEGKICLCLRPPGFKDNKDSWEKNEEVKEILWLQARGEEVKSLELEYLKEEEESDEELDEEGSNDDSDGDNSGSSDSNSSEQEDDLGSKNKFSVLMAQS